MATRKRSPARPAPEPAHPKASAKGSGKAPAKASRKPAEPVPRTAAEPAPIVADRPAVAPATSTAPPAGPPPGTEALQAAALQVIGAARAFLEVAERAVQDPQVLGQVATAAGAVAKGVLGSLGSLAAGSPPVTGRADPPIEHIDLG